MTKQESNVCKGIAIILMFVHHLFFHAEWLAIELGPVFKTPEALALFAQNCKICVNIFVFITAYGTTKSFANDPMDDIGVVLCKTVKRYVSLLLSFQFVYIIGALLCPLSGRSWFTVYSPSRMENLAFALADFMGLSYALGLPRYNSAWWYMPLAFFLILSLPWLIKLCRRYGAYLFLPFLLLLRWVQASDVLIRYFPVALLGILFAENQVVEKIKAGYSKARLLVKLAVCLICLVVIKLTGILWQRFAMRQIDIYETVLCLAVCFLTVVVVAKIPYLNRAIAFLGKYSMNMFLFHAFIYQQWLYDFTYSFRYPVLIFLFLLLSMLVFSIAVEKLKKLLRLRKLGDVLADRLYAMILRVKDCIPCSKLQEDKS